MPTRTQQLADNLLDGKLDEFVQSRRSQGVAWRVIARDIYDETGLDLTHETVRSWFPQREAAAS